MRRIIPFALAVATLTGMSLAATTQPGGNLANIPADKIKLITAAAPEQPAVKPAGPRKLVLFIASKGFKHGSIPYAAKTMEILGEKTGAWATTITDDPNIFAPDKLKDFDAICLNNTTGDFLADKDPKVDAARKKALLDFVSGGKGLAGIHAATDACYKWADYGELIGGYFNGHPWGKIPVKLDDPDSPINAAFEGKGFDIADEIYTFKDPYSRTKQRVLLSLDWAKFAGKGGNRKDNDYAVSWVKKYGDGRVFYCSLGHNNEVFWNPKILRHYLAGVQFALGDLKADTTPNPAPASQPEPTATHNLPPQASDLALAALAPASQPERGATAAPATQPAEGFRLLFNGRDLAGWNAKPNSWAVEDAALVRKGGGDIWTDEPFGDFVLDLEFQFAERANSGVFVRTAKTNDPVQTGIEIQILDPGPKPNPRPGKNDCGAVYDCLAPSRLAAKPAGQWNRVVITARANKLAVVLNGEPIIDMDLDRWTEAGKNPDGSKNKFRTAFKDMARKGHIGFQDHGGAVAFRNILLKPLD